MNFQFIQFCEDYTIPYIEESTSWYNLQCPFCDDHKHHLGYNIKGVYFNCWKCGNHSLRETVEELTGDTYANIMKHYSVRGIILEDLNTDEKIKKVVEKVDVPGTKLQKIHKKYLKSRGFSPRYISENYNIKGTMYSPGYELRIITPIYFNGEVVSYQGRDITNKHKAKYKACGPQEEIILHQKILYNIDNCNNDFIIVCEGVFDVWRLGNDSCATFGKNISIEQLKLLSEYKTAYIFFDNDKAGIEAADKLCTDLESVGLDVYNIVHDTDPADMSQKEANDFMNSIRSK